MFLSLILAIPAGGDEPRSRSEGVDGSGTQTDQMLVRAAQRGDGQAFAALHARYYSRIYRLAYLKTNNATDAEDVASETYLRALTSLPRFDFKSTNGTVTSIFPWLHRLAVNLIVDSHR